MVDAGKLGPDQSVSALSGVGPQIAAKLARMHINTLQDVLFHLPIRYEDRTRLSEIGALIAGNSVVVVGQIELAQVVYGRRRSLLVRISDGTGNLTLRLFHFSRAQEKGFRRGAWVRCFGEVRRGPKSLEMVHPEYRISSERPTGALEATLTPVYSTTEGVSQLLWRKITDQVLKQTLPVVPELLSTDSLPPTISEAYAASSLQSALQHLHRPSAGCNIEDMASASSAAHQRLIYEELLAHHLSLRHSRQQQQAEAAPGLVAASPSADKLLNELDFDLTAAQQRVLAEIVDDLCLDTPMLRLLQGDVGCGKTVVAALAMLHAVDSKLQTALMAPTELLAEQHYRSLKQWFEPQGILVGWLASKTPAKQKNSTLEMLASGELQVVVGTHALFQETVEYHNLGLVVIDEQHRFGVDQRLALRSKSRAATVPHQLVMTATPIPRTLAMSFYADLDVSSIDQLPPGRTPVETVVMSAQERRVDVVKRVQHACAEGRQVYWVCPLIDESDVISAQAATDTEQELAAALPDLRVGLVHGRMKPVEKDKVMTAFRSGNLDILVATTVIEVGVDVPNASLMIVENSERMGLAQLHQLRGRVGRGSAQSYCIMLYDPPLSAHAKHRLQTMRDTSDGFVIAEQDLAMRGAGEMLGTRQTGSLGFKLADIMRDQHLIPYLPAAADRLLTHQPQQAAALIERWVGTREGYVNA
ncbi:MAG: ATP-dependent DNA helicase RecG [Gammaproteobacteria bacterium]|nr:ATP-dependent DNA helicase RecG [Gammaproteobacteria bacterium]